MAGVNWWDRIAVGPIRRRARKFLRLVGEEGNRLDRNIKRSGVVFCPSCHESYKREQLALPPNTVRAKIRCDSCNSVFEIRNIDGEEVVWLS